MTDPRSSAAPRQPEGPQDLSDAEIEAIDRFGLVAATDAMIPRLLAEVKRRRAQTAVSRADAEPGADAPLVALRRKLALPLVRQKSLRYGDTHDEIRDDSGYAVLTFKRGDSKAEATSDFLLASSRAALAAAPRDRTCVVCEREETEDLNDPTRCRSRLLREGGSPFFDDLCLRAGPRSVGVSDPCGHDHEADVRIDAFMATQEKPAPAASPLIGQEAALRKCREVADGATADAEKHGALNRELAIRSIPPSKSASSRAVQVLAGKSFGTHPADSLPCGAGTPAAASPEVEALEALEFALSKEGGFACPETTELRMIAVLRKAGRHE